jgi:hypothetical protein
VEGEDSTAPVYSLRPKLGTKLFDKKLDVSMTWIAAKTTENVMIDSGGAFAEVTYSIIATEHVDFHPYVYFEQNGDSGFDKVQFGPHLELTNTFHTGIGALAVTGFSEPLVEYALRKEPKKAPVTDATDRRGLAVAGETPKAPPTETTPRDPIFLNTTELAVGFTPAALDKLSVTVLGTYFQNWKPRYVAKTNSDDSTRTELDGYKPNSAMLSRLNIDYKLTPTVTLTNSFRYMTKGFYDGVYTSDQEVADISNRFENRLQLSATLF